VINFFLKLPLLILNRKNYILFLIKTKFITYLSIKKSLSHSSDHLYLINRDIYQFFLFWYIIFFYFINEYGYLWARILLNPHIYQLNNE
jgi:surface polysaccharide O-acyltransferase-like enzyme